ncbi:MAG: GtrA family protein [Clostridia bacterium]|jgi:putative flippase GtrA|nr:GtrA family protein [Clostridia bacterium]
MEKIKSLLKKILTKEVILYIIFGVITTLVNLGIFYIMFSILNLNKNLSNIIAIMTAIIVAYFTNKDMVFHSKAITLKERMTEFLKFIAGRAFTIIVEMGGCWLLFQTTIPEMITKLFVTVIVIVLNFFISKFFAFKNK